MTRRRHPSAACRSRVSSSLFALLTLTTAACSSPVALDPPDVDTDTAAACRALVDGLPETVDGQDARSVEPDDTLTAAWGDPAITLRCGVERPRRLQPTSFCFVVNDVGWYAEDDRGTLDGNAPPQGDVVFTTIGRSPYVEITVPPEDSRPAVDPLTDVAAAIRKHTREEQPCQ
ncbi:MAG: DUF3515 domain-containing protein [Actinomycetota bacterium]|nr:DUF3515 domain-containing protein [Actinomycetota bacterium]